MWVLSSVTSESEKWVFCHLFSAVTLNPGILVCAKWEHFTREFWSIISHVHCTAFCVDIITCLLYIFAMQVSELILKYVVILVEKYSFLRKVVLTLVCYLSKCDSWLIFTCICLLQTLINPFCKDKLWLMHILKIYT